MNPLDPMYLKGLNDGKKQAGIEFESYITEMLSTLTDVPGIGDKTAERITEHFMQGMED